MCTRAYWSWRRELPGALSIFLNALEAPRLLFDPAFAPAEGAFLKVAAEACNDGDGELSKDGRSVIMSDPQGTDFPRPRR